MATVRFDFRKHSYLPIHSQSDQNLALRLQLLCLAHIVQSQMNTLTTTARLLEIDTALTLDRVARGLAEAQLKMDRVEQALNALEVAMARRTCMYGRPGLVGTGIFGIVLAVLVWRYGRQTLRLVGEQGQRTICSRVMRRKKVKADVVCVARGIESRICGAWNAWQRNMEDERRILGGEMASWARGHEA